jgi:coenzyme F420 hydrogenase subunit beta
MDLELRDRGQTGGVVSTLVRLALEEGSIQAAILTERQADLLPRGRVVRDSREVVTLAGSGYVAGPTLEALNGGSFENEDRIAVVGLPCQITAMAKMRVSTLDRRTPIDQVVLTIGLFCTWALSHGPFVDYLKRRVGRGEVGKMDITPPPEQLLLVTTDSETSRIPLDEIRPFVRPGCDVCLDMTAELADLSVGTVEGRSGWNTVIVRTRAGKEILSRAEAVGAIETESLAEDYRGHLREASRLKKYRALKALEERGDTDGGYLRLPNRLKRRIMSCGEEGS